MNTTSRRNATRKRFSQLEDIVKTHKQTLAKQSDKAMQQQQSAIGAAAAPCSQQEDVQDKLDSVHKYSCHMTLYSDRLTQH